MKVTTLLSYAVFFIYLFSGCVNDKSDLYVIDGGGLPSEGESYSRIVVLNEKEGYLFGEKHGESVWTNSGEAFRTDTAIVYNTIDGGITWKKQMLGVGTIVNAHSKGSDIYTIRCQSTHGKEISTIYKLNQSTNKWAIITSVDSYVRDADFSNQSDWIITKKENNGDFKVYRSADKGVTWNSVLNNSVFQPVIESTTISFLSSDKKDSGIYNTLIAFNRTNGSISKKNLPPLFEASLLRKYNKSLYIAGVEADSLSIYKLEESSEYSLINKMSLGGRTFPKELMVNDLQLILLAGVRKDMYIENHVTKSVDDGKNWVEEQLYKPAYASPLATYWDNNNSSKTWIYSGSGKIQVLK